MKYDIQAMKQDNDGFQRRIKENELKIVELETIVKTLSPICGGEEQ